LKLKNARIILSKEIKQKVLKLKNARIILSNLIYISGIPESIASVDILENDDFLGQYGKIQKASICKAKVFKSGQINDGTYSAYITYYNVYDASLALMCIDEFCFEGSILKASYGTTKFCTFYLKELECPNSNCLFFHQEPDPANIMFRKEMSSRNSVFHDQLLFALKVLKILSPETKSKFIKINENAKHIFPGPFIIYQKPIFTEYESSQLKINDINEAKADIPNVSNISSNFSSNKEIFSFNCLAGEANYGHNHMFDVSNLLNEVLPKNGLNQKINENSGLSSNSKIHSLISPVNSDSSNNLFPCNFERIVGLANEFEISAKNSHKIRASKTRFDHLIEDSILSELNVPEFISIITAIILFKGNKSIKEFVKSNEGSIKNMINSSEVKMWLKDLIVKDKNKVLESIKGSV